MYRVGKFSKVSFNQFVRDWHKVFKNKYSDEEIGRIYDKICLPKRATTKSAGYDFYSPFSFILPKNESILIPTGIRVQIEDGWSLNLYPRSGLGFTYRLRMDNTVGIIDGDYFNSDNEGHIFVKLTNETNTNKLITISENEAIVQGIFSVYGYTYDDYVIEKRNGGFGSTTKK